MKRPPSTNGGNGRDAGGRFARGNRGGPGNPMGKRTARLRAAMLKAVTAKDIREIIEALATKARGGDVTAAREILDRCVGRPVAIVDIEASTRPNPIANAEPGLAGSGRLHPERAEDLHELQRMVAETLRRAGVTAEYFEQLAEGETSDGRPED